MKKYIIIFFSLLLLAGSLTNAQTIKRSKQKTEKPKTEKPKTEKPKSKPQTQESNNLPKKKKSQKIETPSRSQSSSTSHSSVSASRSPEPTAYDVTFSCNIPDADMFIDGNEYGHPKGTRTLKTGSHQVRLIAEGYEDYTTTIRVNADNTSFNFTMTRVISMNPENTKVETFTVNGISFDMIYVEGGTFMMGSNDDGAWVSEKPVHQVTLSGYYIGKYEVTQDLWQVVMGENPSHFKNNPKNPVECVSWNDCQKFVKELNELTGMHFRLPTEAEWEYAARGGNRSSGNKYAGNNNLDDVAWYTDNSDGSPHIVGSKLPNELDIYDMSGNVDEFCQDRYGRYPGDAQTNPTGPSSGSNRVYRGGSWVNFARDCRVSDRRSNTPSSTDSYMGLRLAL